MVRSLIFPNIQLEIMTIHGRPIGRTLESIAQFAKTMHVAGWFVGFLIIFITKGYDSPWE